MHGEDAHLHGECPCSPEVSLCCVGHARPKKRRNVRNEARAQISDKYTTDLRVIWSDFV